MPSTTSGFQFWAPIELPLKAISATLAAVEVVIDQVAGRRSRWRILPPLAAALENMQKVETTNHSIGICDISVVLNFNQARRRNASHEASLQLIEGC